MITFTKGHRVGDKVIYFNPRAANWKQINEPQKAVILYMDNMVVGYNITIQIGVDTIFTHENFLHKTSEINKVNGYYFKLIMSFSNSKPKKIRKAFKKFKDKFPEYII